MINVGVTYSCPRDPDALTPMLAKMGKGIGAPLTLLVVSTGG